MSLTDQDRIEMAADNCEVLRARLARYEDAEGRALQSAACVSDVVHHSFSRDRDIGWNASEEEQAIRANFDEWLKTSQFTRPNSPWDIWKASARLNSSPVSAGEQLESSYQGDPRSPSELSLAGCNCVRFGEGNPHWPCKLHTPVSAGGVDERAAFETWYLGHFYMGDKQCGLEWLSTEPCGGYRHQHPAEQWVVWQARAALSAPSHGEQVGEGWKLVPVEPNEAIRDAINLLCDDHSAFEDSDAFWSYLLAATPSAGSQEQG